MKRKLALGLIITVVSVLAFAISATAAVPQSYPHLQGLWAYTSNTGLPMYDLQGLKQGNAKTIVLVIDNEGGTVYNTAASFTTEGTYGDAVNDISPQGTPVGGFVGKGSNPFITLSGSDSLMGTTYSFQGRVYLNRDNSVSYLKGTIQVLNTIQGGAVQVVYSGEITLRPYSD